MNNQTNTALAIVPRTLDEVNSLSEMLSKSTLLPDALKGKASDIAVSILAGAELGLAPMVAIRGVHVVQGKPVLSADTMVGLVLSSGACEYFTCIEDTDKQVTYEAKRKGSPMPQRLTWSTDDTKRAALNTKENWMKYPRAMMKARAKASLARDMFPDVLAGVYSHEEIETQSTRQTRAIQVENHEDIADAEIVTDGDTLSKIDAAPTVDELKALVPELSKLSGDARKQAKAKYDARLVALKTTNGVHEATT